MDSRRSAWLSMRQHAVSLEAVDAFVAALFTPWAFKRGRASLIDLIRLDHWVGRRAWIVGCKSMMLATLPVSADIDTQIHF